MGRLTLNPSLSGVAVGAGEIGEGEAKELVETRKQVDALRRQLSIMNQENAQLRARLHSAGLSGSRPRPAP